MPANPYLAIGFRATPLKEPNWNALPLDQLAEVWRDVLRGRRLSACNPGPRDARSAAEVQADGEVDGAMVRPFLGEQLTWEQLPHLRVVHRYGAVATCVLAAAPDSPLTGVLEPFAMSVGIMRYAVAHPTWGRHPLQLGISLKLFRHRRPPANILFNSLYQPQDKSVATEDAWCRPQLAWTAVMRAHAQHDLDHLLVRRISTAPADPRARAVPIADANREVRGTLGAFETAARALGNPQGLWANRVTLLDAFRAGPYAVFGRPQVPFALEVEHFDGVRDRFNQQREHLDLRSRLIRMTAQDDHHAMSCGEPWATVYARPTISSGPMPVGQIYRTSAFISSSIADERLRFPHSTAPDPDYALASAAGCSEYMAMMARLGGCPAHAAPGATRPVGGQRNT